MKIEYKNMDTNIAQNGELTENARAQLREGFLRTVYQLHGEPVNILTYEASTLQANFVGWNTDGTEIVVKNLKTPARIEMPSAILRTPDLLTIQFDRQLQLP